MPIVDVGTPTSTTTTGDIIQSIRDQIPDRVTSPALDGSFTLATLLRWINDAGREIAVSAPVIQDWHAIASEVGMDVYVLPSYILSAEQLWYDNWPCWRAPELDALFVTKIQSRSYYFGPHSIHAIPRLHVWPAADRTAATTTLSTTVSATDRTFSVASVTGFRPYAFISVEGEIILYRTITTAGNQISQTLRGQAGTVAVAHTSGATVSELNIFFKCSRLPVPLTGVNDPFEIPQGLWPLVELYVLSKVREAEQEFQIAKSMREEFRSAIETLAQSAQIKGLRQGIQVRSAPPGPALYFGRVYVP